MQNHYAVLDVSYNASYEEIEINYHLLTRVYHPDHFREPEDKVYAAWKLHELDTAYDALMATAEPASFIVHR